MTTRETRLRERIDTLTDERDRAISASDRARADRDRHKDRIRTITSSRDLWRRRAVEAEREVRRATQPFTRATA